MTDVTAPTPAPTQAAAAFAAAATTAAAPAAVAAPTVDVQALLAEKAALDAKFAAVPVADLVAAASAVLARPEIAQAVADLSPIYEALPDGMAKVHVGNFMNVTRSVPTILSQVAADAASPSGLKAKTA